MKTKTKLTRPKQNPAHKASVTVVIPVLNESRTIGNVVKFALRDPRAAEVLVVDDGSIDGTPERAERAGARVVTSSLLGKGASMEDGLQAANTEFLLYLDGDLCGLRSDLIQRMTRPLFAGKAGFVKAKFERRAGRVTVLTARPLLRTYFPELADFVQPLGVIIAARRSFLQQLRFENDYGVDIGLLIDAAAARARIVEVEIVRRRVFADFTISHVMKFQRDKATGRLTLSPAMQHPKGCRDHRLCKQNVLQHFLDELGIGPERVLAVGDSNNDVCLLHAAGVSVAFQPKTPVLRDAAKHVIEHDLRGILRLLGLPVSKQAEIRTIAPGELETSS